VEHGLDATISVEIASSLTELDPRGWDALAPNDALASYGWLRAVEEERCEGVETLYILVRRSEDLVAAAPCYLCFRRHRLFDPDVLMFGRFRRWPGLLRLSFLPAMLVGPHRSYGQNLLLSGRLEGPERERVCRRLMTEIESLARSRGLPLHFPGVTLNELEIPLLLSERGYHRTRDFPVCCLDIEWDTFDDYLTHLSSFSHHMRRNVKKEINRCRNADILIEEIEEPASHAARLLELADAQYWRLNGTRFPYSARFLTRLKELLGREAVFYGAFRDGSLLGFVVLLRRGESGYLPWTGIDRKKTDNEAAYFNLVYYRPIEDAIAVGLERLHFGKTLYCTKARRGCKPVGMQHFYHADSKTRHAALTMWIEHRVRDLEDLDHLRKFRGN